MSRFVTGLTVFLLAAQLLGAETNVTSAAEIEKEYQALLDQDDAAQTEVDRWIRENQAFAAKGAPVPPEQLNRRIEERFTPVRDGYEKFLKKYPNHAKAWIAYGSFLGDIGDEEGSRAKYEKALQLDPKNPAVYNNLANVYGHSGPVKKAFEFYQKALELNPSESVYYYNFGTTVYLFRKDAKEYYGINEEQVFAKALELYSNAMRLDPQNFVLASDVAQTYYGITPMRTEAALKAWTNAFNVARDEIEREGVQIHFARIKSLARRFEEAQGHLNCVTSETYASLKARVTKRMQERIKGDTRPGSSDSPDDRTQGVEFKPEFGTSTSTNSPPK